MTPPPSPAPADAFEAVALPHLDTLYRVALRLTGEPAGAEDLVQDTMFRAFRAWERFEPGSNARAWLLTILRNLFINDFRRRRLEPIAMDLETVEPSDVFQSLEQSDPAGAFFESIIDARVERAVAALPPEFREVIALSDVEGLPYGEISEILSIPVGTVKSRIFRARRLLQRDLVDYAVEMGYVTRRSVP